MEPTVDFPEKIEAMTRIMRSERPSEYIIIHLRGSFTSLVSVSINTKGILVYIPNLARGAKPLGRDKSTEWLD